MVENCALDEIEFRLDLVFSGDAVLPLSSMELALEEAECEFLRDRQGFARLVAASWWLGHPISPLPWE